MIGCPWSHPSQGLCSPPLNFHPATTACVCKSDGEGVPELAAHWVASLLASGCPLDSKDKQAQNQQKMEAVRFRLRSTAPTVMDCLSLQRGSWKASLTWTKVSSLPLKNKLLKKF